MQSACLHADQEDAMKTLHARRALEFVPVAIGVLMILFALLAGGALAATGGMEGMDGMTEEQMQGMTDEEMQAMHGMTVEEMQALHETDAAASDAHSGMDMGGGSVNWIVIGGFIVLVVGSTLAAVIIKRHLRRRMQTGELAAAGVQDV
jgi:hypothetical protein